VDWELKGVPVRVELGPRDLAEGNVTVVTRHLRQKQTLALAAVRPEVRAIMERVAPELLAEATKARQERTRDVDTFEEAVEAGNSGFARISMATLGADGEDRLASHALSIRCLQRPDGSLAETETEDDAALVAVVGRSY
jgi:prolyl-tRNA synthetase